MLNQFGLDNILKLWIQLDIQGGDGGDGCILLVMTALRGLEGTERISVIHFAVRQQIIVPIVLLYTPTAWEDCLVFKRPWTYNGVLDPHYSPASLSSLGL